MRYASMRVKIFQRVANESSLFRVQPLGCLRKHAESVNSQQGLHPIANDYRVFELYLIVSSITLELTGRDTTNQASKLTNESRALSRSG